MALSVNKGYSLQSTGSASGTWGAGTATSLNEGVFQIVDTNLGGITSKSLSSTPVLLTQSEAQNCMLRLTGTLTAAVDISPDSGVLMTGFVYFENLTTGSFAVTLTNAGGSVTLPQSRRGIVWIDTSNGPRIVSLVGSSSADPIPVGTVMLFYQNAAPAGWTISSALNDYALKIVSASGGVTAGTVDYSTLFGRTETDSHTLTTPEIPSHTHTVGIPGGTGTNTSATYFRGSDVTSFTLSVTSGATGGGNGHTHNIDMRVKTASVILASKN